MSGGRHPKSVSTPNVPAVSSAERKTSGLDNANTVGGTSASANVLGSFFPFSVDRHPSPSARKSDKPRTNPMNDVVMAKKENASTSAFAVSDVDRSAASGSEKASTAPPLRATASIAALASSAETFPRSAVSHNTNMANGIAVPATMAVLARRPSPSIIDATVGTTL